MFTVILNAQHPSRQAVIICRRAEILYSIPASVTQVGHMSSVLKGHRRRFFARGVGFFEDQTHVYECVSTFVDMSRSGRNQLTQRSCPLMVVTPLYSKRSFLLHILKMSALLHGHQTGLPDVCTICVYGIADQTSYALARTFCVRVPVSTDVSANGPTWGQRCCAIFIIIPVAAVSRRFCIMSRYQLQSNVPKSSRQKSATMLRAAPSDHLSRRRDRVKLSRRVNGPTQPFAAAQQATRFTRQ